MLGDIENDIIIAVQHIVGWLLNSIISLLDTSPKVWAESMGIWKAIEDIVSALLPLGCSLVVLFFLIGFCENSINVKEQMRLETILQLFIRIGITQYFVIHCLEIINILFQITTALCGLIHVNPTALVQNAISNEIHATSDMGRIVLLFILLLLLIIAPACIFMIYIMIIMRMFRVLISVPYSALAFSAIASGSHHFSNIAPGYIKYMLSLLLESFSISIALKLGLAAIVYPEGLFSLSSLYGDTHFINAVLGTVQYMFSCAGLLILCKMAQNVAAKALSLER